jgi:hypothetical protein
MAKLAQQRLGLGVGAAIGIALTLVAVAVAHDGRGAAPAVKTTAHVYTIRMGDVIRVPGAATRCVASGEGGFPNLFCTHTPQSRYQVAFWRDRVDVYDLSKKGEPMVPTFSVQAKR